MTRCRSPIKKADVRRCIEAVAKATGDRVARVEIDAAGKVTVIVERPADGTHSGNNEWDTVLKAEPARREPKR
jgi:hypothetical protein